jgi:LmbE family N-acetylglucosaminyl deacetylase
MSNKVVGIFAHPDDEAFGPGGILAKLAKDHEVYIICATNGEFATGVEDKLLGEERRKELEASRTVLGVKKVFFLDYIDGTLSNNLYHEIAQKIQTILLELKPETLITFEPQGVSGHLDHIAISMITQFLFPQIPSATKLMMYAISRKRAALMQGKYFIYFPEGYRQDEFGEIVDVSDVWDTKIKAMCKHKTQQQDIDRVLSQAKNFPKEEYFLIKQK